MTNKPKQNILEFDLDRISYKHLSEIMNMNRGTFSKWGVKGWLHLKCKENKFVDIPKTIESFRGLAKDKEADALAAYLDLKLAHDARNPKPKPKPIPKVPDPVVEAYSPAADQKGKEIVENIIDNYQNTKIKSIELQYGMNKFEAEGYLKTAQAIMAMREEELQRGILVDVREVAKQIENVIMVAKSQLLTIPTKLAPKMVKTKKETLAQQILTDAISEALEDLCKTGEEYNNKAEGAMK